MAQPPTEVRPGAGETQPQGQAHTPTTGSSAAGRTPALELLGDYRILREIGRGGMGIVYEAKQESLGRHVAVKVLPSHSLLEPKHIQRFQREAQAAARLHHTNIVPVFGVGEAGGLHYYAMQFIPGVGLDRVLAHVQSLQAGADSGAGGRTAAESSAHLSASDLARALLQGRFSALRGKGVHHSPGSLADQPGTASPSPNWLAATEVFRAVAPAAPDSRSDSGSTLQPSATNGSATPTVVAHAQRPGWLYWQTVARIGSQVADALRYAHGHGILHRDIKPANLLLDTEGNVWVTDFGLAKTAEQSDLTGQGDVIGTLRYIAPEQFEAKADARSDVYSLGLTLYELTTLRPAFTETDRSRLMHQITHEEPPRPRKLNREIPRDLETIILKAIAKDPAHRYASAAELGRDLQNFMDDKPILARRIGPAERFVRWCRRNPAVASLTATAFTLLVLVAVVAGLGYWTTNNALDQARSEQEQKDRERDRAEKNLRLALRAFEEMFDSVMPRRPTRPGDVDAEDRDGEAHVPIVSPELAALLQRLLRFYDEFADQNRDNPQLRREAARANQRVGDLQQRLGKYPEAEKAYLRAIALYAEVSDGRLESVRNLAYTHNELGMVLYVTGKRGEANKHFQAALQELEAYLKQTPGSNAAKYELARTHYLIGMTSWRGSRGRDKDMEGLKIAEDHLDTAIKRLDELLNDAAQDVREPDYRLTKARCQRQLALVLFTKSYTGSSLAGAKLLTEAIATLQDLIHKHDDVPDYRYELIETYNASKTDVPNPRFREQMLDRFEHSLKLAQELTNRWPSVPEYQATLGRAYFKLAIFLLNDPRVRVPLSKTAIGQLLGAAMRESAIATRERARTLLEKSVTELERLVAKHDNVPLFHLYLSESRYALGMLLNQVNRQGDAQRMMGQWMDSGQKYMMTAPPQAVGRTKLEQQYHEFEEAMRQATDPAEFEKFRKEAMKRFPQFMPKPDQKPKPMKPGPQE